MLRNYKPIVVCLLGLLVAAPAYAQSQSSGSRTSVNGLGSAGTGMGSRSGSGSGARTQGMQQTGQLGSDAAISRDTSAFVGESSGSFLSRSGSSSSGSRSLTSGMSGMSSLGGMSGMSGMGTTGMSGMGGSGRGGMNGSRGMTGNQQYGNQSNSTGRNGSNVQLRNQLRIGFQPIHPVSTEVSTRLSHRVLRIPGLEKLSGVDVKMDGRTAVLQGTVASQGQRDLLARLALLEPGISDVRNELVVGPSSSAESESVPAPATAPGAAPAAEPATSSSSTR